MLRKCDALIGIDQKNAAYQQYSKILTIDPENAIAKNALQNISLRLLCIKFHLNNFLFV